MKMRLTNGCLAMSTTMDTPASSGEDFGNSSFGNLRQLASHLDQWRGLLPAKLQRPNKDSTIFPPEMHSIRHHTQFLDPALVTTSHVSSRTHLFTTDLDSNPILYAYAFDIQVALLRTRCYHAKYMVHRLYIYKALHFPDQMGPMDFQGGAECLKVCAY